MAQASLILSLLQGAITAADLGVDGFAWHRRPASRTFFQGRTISFGLSLSNRRPDFHHLYEGGIDATDTTRVSLWRFPAEIPHTWKRATG
jgi:hypothetical protein